MMTRITRLTRSIRRTRLIKTTRSRRLTKCYKNKKNLKKELEISNGICSFSVIGIRRRKNAEYK